MFNGYDPERRPPYVQEVYYEIDGKLFKRTYTVCNGYGGSIQISSGPDEEILDEDEKYFVREQLNKQ